MAVGEYRAAEGARFDRKNVQLYGEYIKSVMDKSKGDRSITTEHLLELAKKPACPLHGVFTWSDEKAARLYRLQEARHLLNHIRVVVAEMDDGTEVLARPFHNVNVVFVPKPKKGGKPEPTEIRVYTPLDRVLDDDRLRMQVLMECIGWLKHFEAKYNTLRELEPIFKAIGEVELIVHGMDPFVAKH